MVSPLAGCAVEAPDSEAPDSERGTASAALEAEIELRNATILIDGRLAGAGGTFTGRKAIGNVEYGDCTITTGLSECRATLALAVGADAPSSVSVIGKDAFGKRRRIDMTGIVPASVRFPRLDEHSGPAEMVVSASFGVGTIAESFEGLDIDALPQPSAAAWHLRGAGVDPSEVVAVDELELIAEASMDQGPGATSWVPSEMSVTLAEPPEEGLPQDKPLDLLLDFFAEDGTPVQTITLKAAPRSGMATCTAVFNVETFSPEGIVLNHK